MRKMKDSGVAWIGEMPEDWTVKRGKFTLKLLNRPVKESDDVITCFRDGEVTLRTNRRTDGFTVSVKEIGYQGIEPGDLVIHGMDGFAGSIGISDSRGKSSPVLVVCDTDENKRYIMYYLRSMAYNDVFTALATGIRVRSCDLRWNKLAELPYILPNLEEQNQIVLAIESSTSKVDALIANVQAQIEKLKAYKQSLITEVVTKGLDPDAPMKGSGVEWIGEIPEDWEVVPNKRLMRKIKSIRENYSGENVLSLTVRGVIVRDLDNPSGKMPATFDGYQFIEAGNLLMCLFDIDVTPRCIGLIENDGVCSPAYSQFKLNNNADAGYYYYYYLRLDYTKELLHLAKNLRHSLTEEQLGAVPTVLPPMEEQRKITEYLNQKCAVIDRIITVKQTKIEKLEQYKRSLIYEYVTGKKEVS